MAIGDIIVGLDIGASKVCSIVGQVNKFSEIEVIGYGMSNHNSLKKGIITDINSISKAIEESIVSAEMISGLVIKSAYVNIKGLNTRIVKVSAESEVENPNDGVSIKDIDNLFYKVQLATSLEKGEQVIDMLPLEYKVNNRSYKNEPLGSFCREIKVECDVVISKSEYLNPLAKAMEKAGLKLDGVILETLATSNIVLMPEETELGALMVDVGAGHTDISIYNKSKLIFYTTLPVGGDNITNDIALTFDISKEEADKLKRQYNLAIQAMIKNDHDIKLNTVESQDKTSTIKCSDVVMVIEARVKEIYSVIQKIIKQNKLNNKIECMVLTGQGISNIIGVEELAMIMLKLDQVRICMPKLVNVIKPQHTTAFGMVRYISNLGLGKHINSEVEIVTEPAFKDKVVNTLDNVKVLFNNIFNINK